MKLRLLDLRRLLLNTCCAVVCSTVLFVSPSQALVITPDTRYQVAGTLQILDNPNLHFVTWSSAINGPVTASTTVAVGKTWVPQHTKEIVLAGFTSVEGAEPTLGITWSEETSGWFGSWKIYLKNGQGNPIELATVRPREGATYNTLLSYNPDRRVITWRVVDDTGATIVVGGRATEPVSGPLFAVSGVVKSSEPQNSVVVKTMAVFKEYLPVANKFELLSLSDGEIAVVKFKPDDKVNVHIEAPTGPIPGEYRLRFIDNATGRVHDMGPLLLPSGKSSFPLSITELQPGLTKLDVSYSQAGHQWFAETVNLAIGRISAGYDKINLNSEVSKVQTTVRIQADGRIAEVPTEVYATFSRLTWDLTQRKYRAEEYSTQRIFSGLITLDAEQTAIPLSADIPQTGQPGLWEVKFQLKNALAINTSEYTTAHIFTTYPSASANNEKRPFTVAVLPDPQYYSRSYPDIFTRQTEWIAANAQEKSIRLVLGLGDITDTNAIPEWENADRSISLLDGVVPYVMAVGNHDLAGPKGIADRTSTLFNRYFPPSRYENLPSFGGVFQVGRNENSYYTFNLGGEQYLILSLEFGPRNEVLDWANEVVRTHPQHKVIVITHTYTSSSGDRVTPSTTSASPQEYPIGKDPNQSANDGEQMWDKFVRKHANILMVLSGHIGVASIRSQVALGDNKNCVYEILADYQGEPNGGDGWLVLMEFTAQNTIEVQTFSPYRGEYNHPYSARGFTNRFYIDLNRGWIYQR